MVAQNEQPVSTTPATPRQELKAAIDTATLQLAQAYRAYATAGEEDDLPVGVRLLDAERSGFEELTHLLVEVHAQLDNTVGHDGITVAERRHALLRDLIITHWLPAAMNAGADAAAERAEEPMDALFSDVDLYSAWALNEAAAALEDI